MVFQLVISIMLIIMGLTMFFLVQQLKKSL
jgi:hypothetical protein